MNRRDFNRMFGALAVTPAIGLRQAVATRASDRGPAGARRWSLTADVAECCSCAIPCPCNFGRPLDPCRGTRLIQITSGDLEGEDLAGIRFVVSFLRTEWTRIYVDEGMDEARAAALDRLLPVAFAGFVGLSRATARVPLEVESTVDTFRFSVPESTIEMRLLPGLGGGPIRVTGLPSSAFYDYVQYESVVHRHASTDGDWSFSGTNGFRSQMRVSG